MTTRMERVSEDVALAVLRKTSAAAEPALPAGWSTPDSKRPMRDAMNAAQGAAAHSTDKVDQESWKVLVEESWSASVEETVQEYFEEARRDFTKNLFTISEI